MKISFFVPGIPQPGGSKKAFVVGKRAVVVDANKAKVIPWRNEVSSRATDAYKGEPLSGPLEAEFAFVVVRPRGHYGTGRNAAKLKADAPRWPTGPPDTTKLVRAAEDSLKGIIWRDDAQVVHQTGSKDYGDRPGVWITVWEKEGA